MYAKWLGRIFALTVLCCWHSSTAMGGERIDGASFAAEMVPSTAPANLAQLDVSPRQHVLARIDRSGQLHFYFGDGKRWRHSSQAMAGAGLIGSAPLQLARDPSGEFPIAFTVGTRGEMLEIRGGAHARRVSGLSANFSPGGQIELVNGRRGASLFSVDSLGRIWEVDVTDSQHQMVEARHGQFEPGAWIRSDSTASKQVFLVDRRGALVVYRRASVSEWLGPEMIAEGFVSGAPMAVWSPVVMPGKLAEAQIALIDQEGQLQIYRQRVGGWVNETLPATRFSPGTPIGVCQTNTELSLAAVLPDGRLTEVIGIAGKWVERPILDGFPLRAPLLLSAAGPSVYAVDVTDRIIAGSRHLGEWQCVLCLPDVTETPSRLVRRELRLNDREDPVEIEFWNSSRHDIVVRLNDRRIPDQVKSQKLRPGAVARMTVDRRQGGTLEETILVPSQTGKTIEEAQTLEVPPQAFYDVAVYSQRGAFQYVDRRREKAALSSVAATSLVRLGTFSLTPDDPLKQGARIDVVRQILPRGPTATAAAAGATPR